MIRRENRSMIMAKEPASRGPEIGHIVHARGIGPRHGKAPRQQVGTDRQTVAGIRGGAITPLGPRTTLRPNQPGDRFTPTAQAMLSQLDLHARTAVAAMVLG